MPPRKDDDTLETALLMDIRAEVKELRGHREDARVALAELKGKIELLEERIKSIADSAHSGAVSNAGEIAELAEKTIRDLGEMRRWTETEIARIEKRTETTGTDLVGARERLAHAEGGEQVLWKMRGFWLAVAASLLSGGIGGIVGYMVTGATKAQQVRESTPVTKSPPPAPAAR